MQEDDQRRCVPFVRVEELGLGVDLAVAYMVKVMVPFCLCLPMPEGIKGAFDADPPSIILLHVIPEGQGLGCEAVRAGASGS